ncbi:Ctr copper transporter family-domain-containing protein [Aspergillus ambiguus]|uniref:high-affinity Cu transporter CTR3 n=1 Tax=Aspergillus ambiguus TaxID=176160 RepID=UPI003CCDE40A
MDHSMHTMTMNMATTTRSSMSTSTSGMDMGMGMDMGGMDMSSCKISMLWNWNTIDACFLSQSWHITSRGMFAGSCIGVICLVLCLEFLRRIGREYDAFIVRRARLRAQYFALPSDSTKPSASSSSAAGVTDSSSNGGGNAFSCAPPRSQTNNTPQPPFRPSLVEQTVRALLHMLQFAVAYFVMLLAMYFNGYIIICIFIGAFLGSFIFSWEPLQPGKENDATAVTKCCG